MKLSEIAALEAARQQKGYRVLYLVRCSTAAAAVDAPDLGYVVHELVAADDHDFCSAAQAYHALDRLLAVAPDAAAWLPGPVIDGRGRFVPRPRAFQEPAEPRASFSISPRTVPATVTAAGTLSSALVPPAEPLPIAGPLTAPAGALAEVRQKMQEMAALTAHAQADARKARLADEADDADASKHGSEPGDDDGYDDDTGGVVERFRP